MKKIVAILAFFIVGTLSYAQMSDVVRMGLSANPAISFLGSNDPTIAGSGSNVNFGLQVDAEIYLGSSSIDSKLFAITSGASILFNNGGKLTHEEGGVLWVSNKLKAPLLDSLGAPVSLPDGSTLGYKLQQVRIPIGIKMRTNEVGYLRYYGQVPFLIDINTQARGTVTNAGEFNTENKQTINNDVRPLNVSWGVGGGVEYEISTGTSLVGGLFFYGGILDQTSNKGTLTSGAQEKSKTVINSVALKIGVLF